MTRSPRPWCLRCPGPAISVATYTTAGITGCATRAWIRSRVVDAVLQVDHDGIAVEEWRNLRGGLLSISGFHAEEDEPGSAHRFGVSAGLDRNMLVEPGALEMQALRLECVDVDRPADERDLVPGARQHAAEEAAHCARAEHRHPDRSAVRHRRKV